MNMLLANWAAGQGLTSITGANITANSLEVFNVGDIVYYKPDIVIVPGEEAPIITDFVKYEVLEYYRLTKLFTGVEKYVAGDRVTAATCTATPVDPDPTSDLGNPTTPHFYKIKKLTGNREIREIVHQGLLLDSANVLAYYTQQVANITP